MPFSKLNLRLKFKGVHMSDEPIFLLSLCKQADIECILNKVSKNYCLQISRPGAGGGERFRLYC